MECWSAAVQLTKQCPCSIAPILHHSCSIHSKSLFTPNLNCMIQGKCGFRAALSRDHAIETAGARNSFRRRIHFPPASTRIPMSSGSYTLSCFRITRRNPRKPIGKSTFLRNEFRAPSASFRLRVIPTLCFRVLRGPSQLPVSGSCSADSTSRQVLSPIDHSLFRGDFLATSRQASATRVSLTRNDSRSFSGRMSSTWDCSSMAISRNWLWSFLPVAVMRIR